MTYEQLLQYVMDHGTPSEDRTGTGTRSVFGPQIRYDLQKGFPLITTKKIFFKAVVHELLWFLSGSTNIKYLKENGISIWDEWADENGDLGPVYGAQFYRGDQLNKIIEGIKKKPYDRGHVISLWNPEDLEKQRLRCCHGSVIQFYVREDKLSCQMYQRSADLFLGVPFNIASYALLMNLVAQVTGLELGELIITFGDAHIYNNHVDQVREQLSRDPNKYPFPSITLNPQRKRIQDFVYEDITLDGYVSYPLIKGAVSV